MSYSTVQRTVHRRGLHAFKQRKTSRLSKAHKRGRLKFARTNIKKDWSNVVFSYEHKFKQFKGGNPRHSFVWAKSVGEVPAKAWLERHEVAVVEEWPTKGDDINPIENLWAILDERLESKKFTTEEGMKKAILKLWDEVDLSLLHNLIDSIPDRLRRIRKAEGGSIKAVN